MANDERQSVIKRLRAYRGQIEAIMNLLGDKRHLERDEKATAQERLRHLKAKLDGDYKATATRRESRRLKTNHSGTETQRKHRD
jgi:hypothetical protein